MNMIFGTGPHTDMKMEQNQLYGYILLFSLLFSFVVVNHLLFTCSFCFTTHSILIIILQPSQNEPRPLASDAGEAVAMAQEVVKSMLAKGYVLGKDTLSQAKAFDESHQVSATAAAKVAELNQKIGLTDKIGAGVDAIKSVDERYHISETTKSAVSATGRAAASAAQTVVNSSYFSKGAMWLSGALNRAAQAAADAGNRGGRQ